MGPSMRKTSVRFVLGTSAAIALVATVATAAEAGDHYGYATPAGTTHVGSLFQYKDLQGDRLYIQAASGCDPEIGGNPDYYVPDLGADPFNSDNGTSSFADFNGCDTKLFSDPRAGGDSFGYYNAGMNGMNINGSFENRASSVQWD